jgi:hypothetical protein
MKQILFLLPAIAIGADYLTLESRTKWDTNRPIQFNKAIVDYEFLRVEQRTNNVVVSTTGDNHQGCATCAALNPWRPGMTVVAVPAIHHPWHQDGLPYIEATEKWETTQTIRRETATLKWRDQSVTLTNDVVLGAVTNRWKLKTDWEKVP